MGGPPEQLALARSLGGAPVRPKVLFKDSRAVHALVLVDLPSSVQLCLKVLPGAQGSLKAALCCRHTDCSTLCSMQVKQKLVPGPIKTKGATDENSREK